MPRFLHTADLHLNSLRRFSKFYLDRAQMMLREILRIGHEHSVDFILVAGDVYDRRDITHLERQLLSEWLATSDIPIVAISGNHDKRSNEVGDTCLSYLSWLSEKFHEHVVYDGAPLIVEIRGCALILVPFQGWMDQELYLILDALVPRAVESDLPVVVAMHEAVQGCVTDVGMTVTKSNQIRLDDAFPDVTYWALGDMHVNQQVADRAWYSGSPHQTKFDEVQEKGVLIVDTDDPSNPEFVPVPSIPLLMLTEEPFKWPDPTEALVQFRPDGPSPEYVLPPNVEIHPSVIVGGIEKETKERQLVGIFDGLDDALLRASLPGEMLPLAWRIACKLARTLQIDVELPERYQTSTEPTEDD